MCQFKAIKMFCSNTEPRKRDDQRNLHDDSLTFSAQFQILKSQQAKGLSQFALTGRRSSMLHLPSQLNNLIRAAADGTPERGGEKGPAEDVSAPRTDNKQFISEPEKLCRKTESHPAIIRGETEVKWEERWEERGQQSQR